MFGLLGAGLGVGLTTAYYKSEGRREPQQRGLCGAEPRLPRLACRPRMPHVSPPRRPRTTAKLSSVQSAINKGCALSAHPFGGGSKHTQYSRAHPNPPSPPPAQYDDSPAALADALDALLEDPEFLDAVADEVGGVRGAIGEETGGLGGGVGGGHWGLGRGLGEWAGAGALGLGAVGGW
jgi:hypothetical protein